MCIAIVKPLGKELPSKEILRTCWNNNPDGCGFMYNDGKNVIIHKGFTKFKGFYKYLKKLDQQVDLKDKDVVLHFRIATSGGVNRECTHPFPVTKSITEMKKLDNVCEYGFAHNGIIQGYGSKDYSDTMEYISSIIANIHDLDNSEELINALAYDNASRFAVLTKDNFELGGKWEEDKGLYYSNDTYKYDWSAYRSTKVSNSKFDWEELGYKVCDLCGGYCLDKEMVNTGDGMICKWCFDEIMGEVREDYKDEEKLEKVF